MSNALAGGFAQTVTDGPLLAALAVSALAGLVSFLSPCVLPLVPGYLSYVTGQVGVDLNGTPNGGATHRRRVIIGALGFVAGFTIIFTVTGAAIGSAGTWLLVHQPVLEKAIGVLVIVMGLAFAGLIPGMQREWRIRALPASGAISAPVLGAIFALGWTPCITPTLAAVQGLAFVQGSAQRGVLLSVTYALGLGIPFVLVAVGLRWFAGALTMVRKHSRWVTRIGGGLLILVGLMLVTGLWQEFVIWLRSNVGVGEIGI